MKAMLTLGGKSAEIENANKPLSEMTFDEFRALADTVPWANVSDLMRAFYELHQRHAMSTWRSTLRDSHARLTPVTRACSPREFAAQWDRITNEYVDFKYIRRLGAIPEFSEAQRFDIVEMFDARATGGSFDDRFSKRLVDVKTALWYVKLNDLSYDGPFEIIGNEQLHKLTPEAVAWLHRLSALVLQLSVLIEKTLDLSELALTGRETDAKKGKWRTKLALCAHELSVSHDDVQGLLAFHDKFRTAELHKLSSVRAMTSQTSWNHLQTETRLAERLALKFRAWALRE